MIATRSAARSTSERMWLEKITVRPSSAASDSTASRNSRRTTASRFDAGSSRISSSGRGQIASSSATARCCPCECCFSRRLGSIPKRESICASSSRSQFGYSGAQNRITLATVASGNGTPACDWKPMRCFISMSSFSGSRPSTRISPPSGTCRPTRQRSAVVLPAPLRPSRPTTLPFGIASVSPASASTLPNRFLTSENCTASFVIATSLRSCPLLFRS